MGREKKDRNSEEKKRQGRMKLDSKDSSGRLVQGMVLEHGNRFDTHNAVNLITRRLANMQNFEVDSIS
jgi:hypothetical protein